MHGSPMCPSGLGGASVPALDRPAGAALVVSQRLKAELRFEKETAMTAPLVTYAVDGRLGIVTLNRPEKLNAITPELRRLLVDRFHEADGDPTTSVVVLRASGRAFCPDHATRPS